MDTPSESDSGSDSEASATETGVVAMNDASLLATECETRTEEQRTKELNPDFPAPDLLSAAASSLPGEDVKMDEDAADSRVSEVSPPDSCRESADAFAAEEIEETSLKLTDSDALEIVENWPPSALPTVTEFIAATLWLIEKQSDRHSADGMHETIPETADQSLDTAAAVGDLGVSGKHADLRQWLRRWIGPCTLTAARFKVTWFEHLLKSGMKKSEGKLLCSKLLNALAGLRSPKGILEKMANYLWVKYMKPTIFSFIWRQAAVDSQFLPTALLRACQQWTVSNIDFWNDIWALSRKILCVSPVENTPKEMEDSNAIQKLVKVGNLLPLAKVRRADDEGVDDALCDLLGAMCASLALATEVCCGNERGGVALTQAVWCLASVRLLFKTADRKCNRFEVTPLWAVAKFRDDASKRSLEARTKRLPTDKKELLPFCLVKDVSKLCTALNTKWMHECKVKKSVFVSANGWVPVLCNVIDEQIVAGICCVEDEHSGDDADFRCSVRPIAKRCRIKIGSFVEMTTAFGKKPSANGTKVLEFVLCLALEAFGNSAEGIASRIDDGFKEVTCDIWLLPYVLKLVTFDNAQIKDDSLRKRRREFLSEFVAAIGLLQWPPTVCSFATDTVTEVTKRVFVMISQMDSTQVSHGQLDALLNLLDAWTAQSQPDLVRVLHLASVFMRFGAVWHWQDTAAFVDVVNGLKIIADKKAADDVWHKFHKNFNDKFTAEVLD